MLVSVDKSSSLGGLNSFGIELSRIGSEISLGISKSSVLRVQLSIQSSKGVSEPSNVFVLSQDVRIAGSEFSLSGIQIIRYFFNDSLLVEELALGSSQSIHIILMGILRESQLVRDFSEFLSCHSVILRFDLELSVQMI